MAKAERGGAPSGGLFQGLILAVVALAAGAAGAAVPYFLTGTGFGKEAHHGGEHAAGPGTPKASFITFGEVVVNLASDRLNRYLKVKLILVTDAADEKPATDLVTRNKAILKNWLIGYLCDKSLAEVTGTASVNRLRREIQDQFNAQLFPENGDKIRDILFEEFVVQ